MKQIIVNVGDLTIEEKQRVSEALAKIKNKSSAPKISNIRDVKWFYADCQIAWSYGDESWTGSPATHTPQQVLEMASTVDQDVILADPLIITDSAGNIIYDSTLAALNRLIKKRSKGGPLPDSGASVKFDKNGMAIMTTKRKVRKDFDPRKEYSVNVEDCTEEEKKEVQQAFFDVGFKWISNDNTYKSLDAVQYSNVYTGGEVTTSPMYGDETNDCNMTAKKFLELVYEQGHVHSEQMMRYAEDAKTHIVHGVETPDLRFTPKTYEEYYYPSPNHPSLAFRTRANYAHFNAADEHRIKNGLCYEISEEGRQAAIIHAKAMLGDQS